MARKITQTDYERLLVLRTGLRRFLHWSAEQAEATGLTGAQHQLLLAIQGHAGGKPPTIGDLAESLLLRHHSTVGLIDRSAALGLVARTKDDTDRRVVRITLTPLGRERLAALSAIHLEEIRRIASSFGSFADLEG